MVVISAWNTLSKVGEESLCISKSLNLGWNFRTNDVLAVLILQLPFHLHLDLGIDLEHGKRGLVFVGLVAVQWTMETAVHARIGILELKGHLHSQHFAMHHGIDGTDAFACCLMPLIGELFINIDNLTGKDATVQLT